MANVRHKNPCYDKPMLVRNIKILMASKGIVWKEFGVPFAVVDSTKYDSDVYLGHIVKIAEVLGVSIDTLVYTDLSAELNAIDQINKER